MMQKQAEPTGGFFTAKRVLALILLIISLVFIFANTQMATLNLIGIRVTMPGWLWFICLLVIGFIIGSLYPWLQNKRR